MVSWSDGETSSDGPLSAEFPEGGYIPDCIEDPTWCGIALNTTYVCCVHKELPEKRVAYHGRNTGRRFLACAVENEVQNCGFVEWIDPEWPDSLQFALHQLWSKVDELTAVRLEEQLDNHVVVEKLDEEKKELEKKYSDLKAEVNKMLEDSAKQVQMANYAKLKEEDKEERKYEAKLKQLKEERAEMVLENKKLKEERAEMVLENKELKEERAEMVEENKKLKEVRAQMVEENKKLKEVRAQMVEENKKLEEEMFVLKEGLDELETKSQVEKEEWKGEKKKLEHALYDLFIAHIGKKEQLKKIQQILDESEM